MTLLSHSDIVTVLLSLGVLLAAARVCGEIARRFNQPAIFGELLAGVILGPTVMGTLFPAAMEALFPAVGSVPVVLRAFTIVSITLFLLVAGMEVDLSTILRQGKAALYVSMAGVAVPFAIGITCGGLFPTTFGSEESASRLVFALFLATALSISALPVIARTLMDLNLYRSDLGMLVVASAVVNDLIGWVVFAVILGMIGGASYGHSVAFTIFATLAFAGFMLTAGRWLIHRTLPWIQAHSAWPGGVLSFALAAALLSAALTEWIGVHAVFGAFLAGVAIGDSAHLREQTRNILIQFVSFIFAPIFFASVGLRINFLAHLDIFLTVLVLVIAFAGKILGCSFGARLGGMEWRESWATGFAMNARGAMEIILGLLALENGIIRHRMFVALVIMAMVTSLISGPAMRVLLRLRNPRRLDRYMSAKAFFCPLGAATRRQAVRDLSTAAAAVAGLDPSKVDEAVWEREMRGATGIGNQIAVPHARLAGMKSPVVALGISSEGIDFDAPDGEEARLICLLLTPEHDDGAQVELLADVAQKLGPEENRLKAFQVANFTEFLAFLRTL